MLITFMSFMIRLAPTSTLFPYTTLFRSRLVHQRLGGVDAHAVQPLAEGTRHLERGADAVVLEIDERDQAHAVRHVLGDRKSTRLNSSHLGISYAVFCLKKKTE